MHAIWRWIRQIGLGVFVVAGFCGVTWMAAALELRDIAAEDSKIIFDLPTPFEPSKTQSTRERHTRYYYSSWSVPDNSLYQARILAAVLDSGYYYRRDPDPESLTRIWPLFERLDFELSEITESGSGVGPLQYQMAKGPQGTIGCVVFSMAWGIANSDAGIGPGSRPNFLLGYYCQEGLLSEERAREVMNLVGIRGHYEPG